jgi:hypothetical protein
VSHQNSACIFFNKRWVDGASKVRENKTVTNKVMKFCEVQYCPKKNKGPEKFGRELFFN